MPLGAVWDAAGGTRAFDPALFEDRPADGAPASGIPASGNPPSGTPAGPGQ